MSDDKNTAKTILDWVKIPFTCIVFLAFVGSGIILFASDKLIEKLFLIEFRSKNGSWMGILFIISTGLLLFFIGRYIFNKAKYEWRKKTYARRTIKKLNQTEQQVIMLVYRSPNHCASLDFNNPIVKSLSLRRILYFGDQQVITYDVYTNKYPASFVLHSLIVDYLDKAYLRGRKQKAKTADRLAHCKGQRKKQELNNKMAEIDEFLNIFEGDKHHG